MWSVAASSGLHWRCWDDRWVVFDEGSGQTHLLEPLCAAILLLLEEGAADPDTLKCRIVGETSIPDRPALAGDLQASLEQLAGVGLVRPSPA
jgi:PqqD family protein of HPr-rel-A system